MEADTDGCIGRRAVDFCGINAVAEFFQIKGKICKYVHIMVFQKMIEDVEEVRVDSGFAALKRDGEG